MFTPTSRFAKALELFVTAHKADPTLTSTGVPESVEYHESLDGYVRKLFSISREPSLAAGPSEALLLAANCQHIQRWTRPRSDWPEGLSGYKTWRTQLNRFHAEVAEKLMVQAGYTESEDAGLILRVKDLLLKKTLARPPLPTPLKDPEMHLFEDAICLVFLTLQFADFAKKVGDEDKMVVIVKKTWAKMTEEGRSVVANELVGALPEDLKALVGKALA